MRKYSLIAGSHVVGDKVYMPGDEVASDDDLTKLHKNKFVLLPEPVVVYQDATTTQAPATTTAEPSTSLPPEPAPEAVSESVVEDATETEAKESVAPKAKKAK